MGKQDRRSRKSERDGNEYEGEKKMMEGRKYEGR